jgi:glycosyltransferase involved in cell wall biosynthesis
MTFALYTPKYFPEYVGGGERLVQLVARGLTEIGEGACVITAGAGPAYEYDGVPVHRTGHRATGPHWSQRGPDPGALADVLTSCGARALQTTSLIGLEDLAAAARETGVQLGMTATEYGVICDRQTLVRGDGTLCPGPESLAGCFACRLQPMRRRDRALGQAGRVVPPRLSRLATGAGRALLRRPVGEQLHWWQQAQAQDARRRRALAALDAFIAPTRWTLSMIAPHLAATTRTAAIMHPLPESLRTPEPKSTPAEVLRVGFVGRALPIKGLHTLVAAVESLVSRMPVELRVHCPANAGELADYWRPLEERVERLSGSVWSEHGALDAEALRAVHREIDVLAVPSEWPEWLGLVTLEAQGLGTPVILSDMPSQHELGEADGRSCWFVPPGDAAALARCLQNVRRAKREGKLRAPQAPYPSPAEYARQMLAVYDGPP